MLGEGTPERRLFVRSREDHARCRDRIGVTTGNVVVCASNFALDTTPQIGLLGKLTLKKCASRSAPGRRHPRRVFSFCSQKRSEAMVFQPGQSGNPAGRPPGARNKATVIAEMLLQGEAEELTRMVIDCAKRGSTSALRMCLDRLVPRSRHRTIAIELPPLKSAADAASVVAAVTAQVAAGEITPREGGEMLKLVDVFLRTYESTILEERVKRLERRSGSSTPPQYPGGRAEQGGAP
jgi:uncharacterized protein DUF5681